MTSEIRRDFTLRINTEILEFELAIEQLVEVELSINQQLNFEVEMT